MKAVGLLAFVSLGAAWAYIYLTTSGVLVGSQLSRPVSASQDVLKCSYFTGTSIIEKEFWYAGAFGRDVCPRLIQL